MSEEVPHIDELVAVSSHLPAMVLSVVVIICVYLALNAFREARTETKLKEAMYEETGVDGVYHYKLPDEEKVCCHILLCFLCVLDELYANEGILDIFQSKWESSPTRR